MKENVSECFSEHIVYIPLYSRGRTECVVHAVNCLSVSVVCSLQCKLIRYAFQSCRYS